MYTSNQNATFTATTKSAPVTKSWSWNPYMELHRYVTKQQAKAMVDLWLTMQHWYCINLRNEINNRLPYDGTSRLPIHQQTKVMPAVFKIKVLYPNVYPPPRSQDESSLPRTRWVKLTMLRSGYCKRLHSIEQGIPDHRRRARML